MRPNALLRQMQKWIVFRMLSAEFFFRPAFILAFSLLHEMTPKEKREYQLYRLGRLLRHARHAVLY
ncbi:MAG: hypothetical protein Q8P56_07015, partial [Candidatus Uhrbacteria bacterium]|nr:hypothetical protein [Candidatus Uhrbacteria bacterium]